MSLDSGNQLINKPCTVALLFSPCNPYYMSDHARDNYFSNLSSFTDNKKG